VATWNQHKVSSRIKVVHFQAKIVTPAWCRVQNTVTTLIAQANALIASNQHPEYEVVVPLCFKKKMKHAVVHPAIRYMQVQSEP